MNYDRNYDKQAASAIRGQSTANQLGSLPRHEFETLVGAMPERPESEIVREIQACHRANEMLADTISLLFSRLDPLIVSVPEAASKEPAPSCQSGFGVQLATINYAVREQSARLQRLINSLAL